MTMIDGFRNSLANPDPPAGLGPALQALWWSGRGAWDRAHGCVQDHEGDADCDLVHAHLHRQEGDLGNAGYWYRRAGRTPPAQTVPEEWEAIAVALLANGAGSPAS